MKLSAEKIKEALVKALEDKGKRKFKQTVELIINFKEIDFSKPENRINAEIVLPKGRGKENKVTVIGDEAMVFEAKKLKIDAFTISELKELVKEKRDAKKFAKRYDIFLVQPQLIGEFAKILGRYLGQAGKTPKPLLGNLQQTVERAKHTVIVKNKGKFVPTLQAPVGTEDMSTEDLMENIEAVLNKIKEKVNESLIKSIYLKLTMGRPVKVEEAS